MHKFTANCRNIGDKFYFQRNWFVVVKANPFDRCKGCILITVPYCQSGELLATFGRCCQRKGKVDVSFRKATRPAYK